jgi:hypothetical protein
MDADEPTGTQCLQTQHGKPSYHSLALSILTASHTRLHNHLPDTTDDNMQHLMTG